MRRTSPYRIPFSSSTRLLADIHRRIGSNFSFEVLRILATVPGCLESFWAAAEPVWNSGLIGRAANDLRKKASRFAAQSVPISDHLCWLSRHGYSREESRQIRYVVEAFYNLEPISAVFAVMARSVFGASHGGSAQTVPECYLSPGPIFTGTIQLAGESGRLWRIFPQCSDPDQSPHPLARALGMWPEYSKKLHEELNNPDCAERFARAVDEFRACLDASAECAAIYISPCQQSHSLVGIKAAIERSADASCWAIVLASALRRSFIKAEVTARQRRMSALARQS